MGCRSFGVNMMLVGLHRIGVVGFKEALERAAAAGLTDREAIVDLLIDSLAADNFIPEPQVEAFRTALWREYLRFQGEDFSGFYSEVEVTVRGDAGEERDRFMETLTAVLGEFELKPTVTYAVPGGEGPHPQLVINDETLVRGCLSRQAFKAAIRQSISDW